MTTRVLIAWEFGSGLGHFANMWPIIKGLRTRGVEPIVAVPDPVTARTVLGADAPRFIKAVPLALAGDARTPIHSLADILLQRVFADTSALRAAVDRWQTIYREERIDTVLLDYAPVAQLAAWLMSLRMVTWSFVFANPPVPLPAMVEATPRVRRAMVLSETRLLASVNEIARQLGRSRIPNLAPWMHAPRRFTKGFPETNIFDFEPEHGYLGDLGDLPGLPEPEPWPDNGRRRVLCYLRWSVDLPKFVAALRSEEREVICVVPGAPAEWLSEQSSNVRKLSQPVNLRALIRGANSLVSHGSLGIACAALVAGIRQLLLPVDLEKLLISSRLARLGCAASITPQGNSVDAAEIQNRFNALEQAAWPSVRPSIGSERLRAVCEELCEFAAG